MVKKMLHNGDDNGTIFLTITKNNAHKSEATGRNKPGGLFYFFFAGNKFNI